MIRSALLALDTSRASSTAVTFALRFCQRHQIQGRFPVRLTGFAVVDRDALRQRGPVDESGSSRELLLEARQESEKILEEFVARCQEAGIPYDTIYSEGDPHSEIEEASRRHDIVIIGRDTDFLPATADDSGLTVKRLLRSIPRPVVVTADEDPKGESIVITCDGSLQSSRSLHLFTLLNFRVEDRQVHVVSVSADHGRAVRHCDDAVALLAHHGIGAKAHPIVTLDHASDVLREFITPLRPHIVVMGVYGNSGLGKSFFGSVTSSLLQDSPYHVFLSQ